MASIRERAAALKLAEKLCVRPPGAHGASSKPVQTSSMWSGLISHLRSSVTVKRRRVHLKSHADCFLGSEAVDVVAEHIRSSKGFEVSGGQVTRDKVVCVCQALLDCHVFEAVGTKVIGKDRKQDVFQDSKSALYRFVGVCTPSVDDLERGVLENGIQRLFFGAASDRDSHVQMSTPLISTETSRKANHLEVPTSTGPSLESESSLSLSPSRVHNDPALSPSVVEEVWQEQTLLRLLKLVELPVLEGLIQCGRTPSPPPRQDLPTRGNPDLIYSSNHLDRRILEAFRDSQGVPQGSILGPLLFSVHMLSHHKQEEEWLCAALDCLGFLPDQPVVALSRELSHCFLQDQDSCDQEPAGSGSQDGETTRDEPPHLSQSVLDRCKLQLYGTLVKHYGHADRTPLMPRHMTDIYGAITDLLVNAKLSKALEALQLCLKLLPPAGREELRRLLAFMALAADPHGIRLDKEVENRLAVKRSFSRAILHNKGLSKDNEDLMVFFMLSNVKDIFKIPAALHKGVSEQLASLAQETPPDVTGSTFCQHASSKTSSTKTTTNQELRALLSNIHLDSSVSSKKRKQLLRQFHQAHPEVFNQYFGDSALGVL